VLTFKGGCAILRIIGHSSTGRGIGQEMYILRMWDDCWDYHHAKFESHRYGEYKLMKVNEGWWIVPGTHPDDPMYGVGDE